MTAAPMSRQEKQAGELAGFVPAGPFRRTRLPWRRTRRGLEGIPERYRLQFLLLAADRLPGGTPAQAAELAAQAADRVRLPARLVATLPDTRPLDEWFRSHTDDIERHLDELAGARR